MSIIDQDGRDYTVKCDTCWETKTFTAGSEDEFLETVKTDRWKTVVTETGIEHTCPDCQKPKEQRNENLMEKS